MNTDTADIASTRADEMRRAWADRTPHEIHQTNLAAFRRDIDKGHPWIPGAAFIACPGLAEHLYAAFADWVTEQESA